MAPSRSHPSSAVRALSRRAEPAPRRAPPRGCEHPESRLLPRSARRRAETSRCLQRPSRSRWERPRRGHVRAWARDEQPGPGRGEGARQDARRGAPMAVSSGPSDQTSSAETTRLGSSTAWRANPMRQLGSEDGHVLRSSLSQSPRRGCTRRVGRLVLLVVGGRDDPKAGPYRFDIWVLVACHSARLPASCAHSSSPDPLTTPSGEERARTQASTTFAFAPGRPVVGATGVTRPRARASVTAHISVRRTSSLGTMSRSSCRLVGTQLKLAHRHERGRESPHQRLDPTRSCPSTSGRQTAVQRPATNSRWGSSRPRERSSTTMATAWAAKRISGASATPTGPASGKGCSPLCAEATVERNFAAADGSSDKTRGSPQREGHLDARGRPRSDG